MIDNFSNIVSSVFSVVKDRLAMRTIVPFTVHPADAAILKLRIMARTTEGSPQPDTQGVEGPCRLFTGWDDGKGYKKIKVHGKPVYVHRAIWTIDNGPIPEGLVLDHKCRNRNCCNSNHLEPVTVAVNTERGNGRWVYSQKGLAAGDSEKSERHP